MRGRADACSRRKLSLHDRLAHGTRLERNVESTPSPRPGRLEQLLETRRDLFQSPFEGDRTELS